MVPRPARRRSLELRGAETSSAALRRRGGKVGGGQILLQTWRAWQRVRFDPESHGEITEGLQAREENDAI